MASFSDDRGATWMEVPQGSSPDDPPTLADSAAAERIAVVTTGIHAGRLAAAGLSGITTSDDGGYTWQATSEWAYFQQSTNCIATLHGQAPDGGDRLVTVINDVRVPGSAIYVSVSDDGGDTWQRGQGLSPGVFPTCMEIVDLGDGRAAAVMMRGPLWWTADAGETWTQWAEWEDLVPPTEITGVDARARWAIVDPDGHLIVGITSNGSDTSIYDKRSSEPVASWAVSKEPAVEVRTSNLRVYPNPTGHFLTVALSGTASPSPLNVFVSDAQGREVYRHQLAFGSSSQVDVSTWTPGIYHARVEGNREVEPVSFTVVR
ncbi:MAG: hypothetical protein Rubg2KO_16020 [Rubricoccaceae bacterium]